MGSQHGAGTGMRSPHDELQRHERRCRGRANIVAMTSLMSAGDPPSARCSHCGAIAAGPCARCRRPTCGDCCELTEGGATTFAVCLACVKRGGKSLTGAYVGLLLWLGGIFLALIAVAALLVLLRR
jgi:hypothetical protein